MSPGAVLLVIVGAWLIAQVLFGNAFGRLGL